MDNVSDILNALSVGWIGSILGVIGLAYAIISNRRNRVIRRLSYKSDNNRVVGFADDMAPDIEVRYRGEVVPRVSTSYVSIWNTGNKIFRHADIVETSPLRIAVPEGSRILSHEIVKRSRDEIAFTTIQEEPNSITLSFLFLEPNDGAVIMVIHTAPQLEPALHGTLIGLPNGLTRVMNAADLNPKGEDRFSSRKAFVRYMGSSGALPFLLLMPLAVVNLIVKHVYGEAASDFGYTYVLYPLVLVVLFCQWVFFYRLPLTVPKALRK